MAEGRELSREIERREEDAESATLVDYALVVWRYRWLIIVLSVGALLGTFVITLTRPKMYESTASLVAPKEGPERGLLGGLAVATGLVQQAAGLSLPSLTPNRDLIVSVLRSRTIGQATVERFKLRERYRAQYLEDAIRRLRDLTVIAVSKEGVIAVTVEDIDRWQAAEMANFYVAQLDRLMAQYTIGEAGHQRVFLAEQLARARAGLDSFEEALRRFQERNKAIVLQEQTRGAIEAAARLKGEIMAAQVQLQVVRNFATEANPEVIALRRRIDEMNRQLAQMEYGDGAVLAPVAPRDPRGFVVPFARVPEVGLELARLMRGVKIQETLVTLLAQQLEFARITEAKDLPTVQVLDQAVPSERYSRPRMGLNLAIAGAGSLLASIFLAFFLDYLKRVPRRARAVQGG